MGQPLIRVGDKTSHGGEVMTGSANMIVDGKEVARLGDKVTCPQCGDTAAGRFCRPRQSRAGGQCRRDAWPRSGLH